VGTSGRIGGDLRAPDTHARRIDHTHYQTEDGFPEIYLLLRSHTDAQGRVWIQLRIPGRPNGRTGWVSRDALGAFHETHWLLVINRRARQLTAFVNGHLRFAAPVGVGKPSTPTPPGTSGSASAFASRTAATRTGRTRWERRTTRRSANGRAAGSWGSTATSANRS
jgi:hypothetical protein